MLNFGRPLILVSLLVIASGHATAVAAEPQIKIKVGLSPAGSFVAQAEKLQVKGRIDRQGDLLVARDIVLDLNTLRTGISLRDRHLREKYLETHKFPRAVLKEARAKNGRFAGTLRIRDIDRKIAGSYKVASSGYVGVFKTKLSDFNIEEANYMGVGVDDEVEVEVLLPTKTK